MKSLQLTTALAVLSLVTQSFAAILPNQAMSDTLVKRNEYVASEPEASELEAFELDATELEASDLEASDLEARQSGNLAKVILSCTKPNTVAITFDDGPWDRQLDLIKLLDDNQVKATFFVNGNNFHCIYDQGPSTSLKKAFTQGHQIASHTWAHNNLSTLTLNEVQREMSLVEEAMEKILGVKPAMMRPPFGAYNDLVRQAAGMRNQSVIIWDLDSGDSFEKPTVAAQKKVYTDAVQAKPKSILTLNHETFATTIDTIIPFAIQQLKAAGYSFSTVADCLGMEPYQSPAKPAIAKELATPRRKDSTWKCVDTAKKGN